jgi:hypothetical protein
MKAESGARSVLTWDSPNYPNGSEKSLGMMKVAFTPFDPPAESVESATKPLRSV